MAPNSLAPFQQIPQKFAKRHNNADQVILNQHLINLNSEAGTHTLAADLALAAKPGDLITLSGELGAGKTSFAREFIRRFLRMPELEIPSPTYLISLDYENSAGVIVTHIDLYRISDPSEIDELGLDEALERGVVIVEWPQNAGNTLPTVNLTLDFNITGSDTREIAAKQVPGSSYLRSMEIGEFLRKAWPGELSRKPFATDASARNYELVNNQNDVRLLMDAPKAPDGPAIHDGKPYSQIAKLAEEVKPFIAIANLLNNNGIKAPKIYASDMDRGLVLLEHLGQGKITDGNSAPIPDRYIDAARLLAQMHEIQWPDTIIPDADNTYTIPEYDQSAMIIEVQLLTDWYLQNSEIYSTDEECTIEFKHIWNEYCKSAQAFEKSIVLRDFHSPNIIWTKSEDLMERIAVIDFQDALIGPAAYDLVSLAQDARVVIAPQLEEQIVKHYLTARQSKNPRFNIDKFRYEYAMMGAQRASKIMGIFVRLDKRDHKPQYRALLPVIRDYLKRNLQHPQLSAYRQWCERIIKL